MGHSVLTAYGWEFKNNKDGFLMSSISEALMKRVSKDRVHESKGSETRKFAVFSSSKIWTSKVGWRIAATVFMAILLVQTTVLNLGVVGAYEKERLDVLAGQAKAAIASIIDTEKQDANMSPFEEKHVERLLKTSPVLGVSVYSYSFEYIRSYGSRPSLRAEYGGLEKTYRSPDGVIFETIFKGADLQSAYIIVAKVDASQVRDDVFMFIVQNIGFMIILSLIVTVILMIALGKWLLDPILFMKANLIAAFVDPESPSIKDSPFWKNDEIGATIDLIQKLINQNAENIVHIKSTAEDKIHKLAYYDSLTGLPNRALFIQKLAENARLSDDEKVDRFAVITVDLDHFKDINDSMGHNVGDAILRSVGKKLRAALPESAMVSRTGEDEFALMLPLTHGSLTSREIGERVASVIRSEPFKVFNEEFQVRASVGVSTYPDDGIEPDLVLKNADIALNRAKEEGRDRIKEYTEDFDKAVQERFQMLRDLRDALEHEQLQLYFQPQLDLKTGKIIGAEALLRWWKPDGSKDGGTFISPGQFIPVAEQSGLIVPIGEWVLRHAIKIGQEIKDKHDLDIRFAVNVSGNQFSQSDLAGYVSKLLSETGFDPAKLELEVTESVFMHDIHHTVQVLQSLNALGVELAIDDFGTGYSSLSYLSQFPIDRLKIDQSFIRNALNDAENASITRTIINLGHSLNLKVIAEGVETKDHETFLIEQGCDEVQGYRYCRPIPHEEMVEFVKNYNGKLESFDE